MYVLTVVKVCLEQVPAIFTRDTCSCYLWMGCSLTTSPVKTIWGSVWICHAGLRLMDMSTSPGNALNALPRSSALALCSTERQQALTASLP